MQEAEIRRKKITVMLIVSVPLLLLVAVQLLLLQHQGHLHWGAEPLWRLLLVYAVAGGLALLAGFAGNRVQVVPDAGWFRPGAPGPSRAQWVYVAQRLSGWCLGVQWFGHVFGFAVTLAAFAVMGLLSLRYGVLWRDIRRLTPGDLLTKYRWVGFAVIGYYLGLALYMVLRESPWWQQHVPTLVLPAGLPTRLLSMAVLGLPFLGIMLGSHVLEFRALGRKAG